jgi:hypothetical protein
MKEGGGGGSFIKKKGEKMIAKCVMLMFSNDLTLVCLIIVSYEIDRIYSLSSKTPVIFELPFFH